MWTILLKILLITTGINTVLGEFTKLSESLEAKLAKNGAADILISVGPSPELMCQLAALNTPSSLSSSEKTVNLIKNLKQHSATTQKPVLDLLHSQGIWYHRTFWISNLVHVPQCHAQAVAALQLHDAVIDIQEDSVIPLEPILNPNSVTEQLRASSSWGIASGTGGIGAPDVWAKGFRGQGVIVATIDTGVRSTHQDLSANYLGLWHDPGANATEPEDAVGHGTHTMGTIVGANGIGVAPDAKWFTCRGCQTLGCTKSDLIACGQWVICPNTGCTMKPHVVSNSWGSSGIDLFYAPIVACWRAANIFPVFANGNEGPTCGSSGSPGRYSTVVSVGAIDSGSNLANFSSRGLTTVPVVVYPPLTFKPDLAAPGVGITSAWYTSDTAYNTISGTSMATPHVAGVVALILSACQKGQSYTQLKTYLLNGARQNLNSPSTDTICEVENDNSSLRYPNQEFGAGALNALNSVNMAQQGGATCNKAWTVEDYMHPSEKTRGLTFPSLI